ncbi:ATP-grasp domain-containing protein [Alkalicoccus daliensis]|uniref:D-alanine-D-alanine ligase n=1 Tax=Alkalicoccus daliensis TaxID=745820 RepID=A0A1H0GIQ9_9BACI|nr:ATP-grasp domain-containing protein [Alkalicoccus daliensis]SDO06672.1 D-alanine-D-alanine ligase [Alkalicoccus daliensis]
MEQLPAVWLSHLEHAIPSEAKEKKISLYMIALEGWRRGLTLTFLADRGEDGEFQLRYSLSSAASRHYFQGSKGDKISEKAQEICDDKSKTNAVLKAANVPVPLGSTFTPHVKDESILQYAKEIGYPVVLKPTNASGGKGVVVNIQAEEELERALEYVRGQLKLETVIVEQFVQGEECRVLVLEGKVLAAVQRAPANVIGDGRSSIQQLIDKKNEARKRVPHLANRPIKLDKQFYNTMHTSDWTLKTVPAKGEKIIVKRVSNISAGGDPVDVTDILSEKVKAVAVDATAAIPDLPHSGVDLMVDFEKDKAVVIEVNTRPGLGSHLFPMTGIGRDIPKALIDFYFPESRDAPRAEQLFFEIKEIEAAIKTGMVEEVQVKPARQDRFHADRISVTSSALRQQKQKIEQYLREKKFIGKIEIKKNEALEGVIAHTDKQYLKDFFHWLEESGILAATECYSLPLAQELSWYDDTKPSLADLYSSKQQVLQRWKEEEKKTNRVNRQWQKVKERITKRISRKQRL